MHAVFIRCHCKADSFARSASAAILQATIYFGEQIVHLAAQWFAAVGYRWKVKLQHTAVGSGTLCHIFKVGNHRRGIERRLNKVSATNGFYILEPCAEHCIGINRVNLEYRSILHAQRTARAAEKPEHLAGGIVEEQGLTIFHVHKQVVSHHVHTCDCTDSRYFAGLLIDARQIVHLVAGVVVLS